MIIKKLVKERDLKRLTKPVLINKYRSLKANYTLLIDLLCEYKVDYLFLQRTDKMQKKKIEHYEKLLKHRINFSYLGSRHNRDIGALKRRSEKHKVQKKNAKEGNKK